MKNIIKKIIYFFLAPFIIKDYLKFWKGNDERFKLSFFDLYPQIKNSMIIVNLKGGLGNQMFQYMLGYIMTATK